MSITNVSAVSISQCIAHAITDVGAVSISQCACSQSPSGLARTRAAVKISMPKNGKTSVSKDPLYIKSKEVPKDFLQLHFIICMHVSTCLKLCEAFCCVLHNT